jgi:gag-polypeptide of LTR copia-type
MSSNNTASLVPILDGTNYRQWAVAMKAFIMSTGLWAYVEGSVDREAFPEKKDDLAKLSDTCKEEIHIAQRAWDKDNNMVIRQIMLRLVPTVQQNHTTYVTSYWLWIALRDSYGKATASSVLKDFKDCLNACILLTANPNIYFNKMFGAFAWMSTADVAIPPQLQAMIALAALPQKWEMLISIITGDIEMDSLDLGKVCDTIITQFQVDSVCHGLNQHNTPIKSA